MTYRVGAAAYVHRWWRLERSYRVFETDAEFESVEYYIALHEHDIGYVIRPKGPLYSDFFEALEAPLWGPHILNCGSGWTGFPFQLGG